MSKHWGERFLSHVDIHFMVVLVVLTILSSLMTPLSNLSREIQTAAFVGMAYSGFCTVVGLLLWVPWYKGLRRSLLFICVNFGVGFVLGFFNIFITSSNSVYF